ncbi:lysophospholipid acyltransferase family protein [Aquabacterium sp.]|uniref:lysophospholipid acyltransferase family protein n=1 Tax=Aquabacterium sp. TaxID=1872578 RepID=UPI002488A0BD|nr:lysophospholipid acyltransferase family protein [Aquabacterium sp.]MDI1258431.1 lysophospholipid acyltransferase family protein [Aquabacterium sp.]
MPDMKTLRALAQYPLFYAGLLLLGVMCLGLCMLAWAIRPFVSPQKGRTIGRAGISRGFRLYFALTTWLGLTRFELEALDALDGQASMILACNHPTFLDAVFLISRIRNAGCIMKADVLDNPFLGAGARLADFIRNDSPRKMVRHAIRDLRQGSHVLVFPEGTRTIGHPVNEFKPGFALIAKGAKVPVQTLFIENNSPFLCKGWPIHHRPPSFPMVYRVRLGKRFTVGDDAKLFTRELQHYFEHELARAELAITVQPSPSERPVHD